MTDVTTMSVLELLAYWSWTGNRSSIPFLEVMERRKAVVDELERRIEANRVEPICASEGCQL